MPVAARDMPAGLETPFLPRDSKQHNIVFKVNEEFPPDQQLSAEAIHHLLRQYDDRLTAKRLDMSWRTLVRPQPGYYYIHLLNDVMERAPSDGFMYPQCKEVNSLVAAGPRDSLIVNTHRGVDPNKMAPIVRTRYQMVSSPNRMELVWYGELGAKPQPAPQQKKGKKQELKEPAKPKDAFNNFAGHAWGEIKREAGEDSGDASKLSSMALERWQALTPDERKVWHDQAAEDARRYEADVAALKKKLEDAAAAKAKNAQPPKPAHFPYPLSGDVAHNISIVATVDEADDEFSAKYVAAARYHRNHALMAEVFEATRPLKRPTPDSDEARAAKLKALEESKAQVDQRNQSLAAESANIIQGRQQELSAWMAQIKAISGCHSRQELEAHAAAHHVLPRSADKESIRKSFAELSSDDVIITSL